MADMLVKLYDLMPAEELLTGLQADGIVVRRALSLEKRTIADFVARRFSASWQGECEVALTRQPVSCFVAVQARPPADRAGYPTEPEQLLGFACYDATCRGFFGPFGVREDRRGRSVGKGLLLRSLWAMREEGYGYAIIGWAGPAAFFQKTVGATVIEGSEPGIYRAPLAVG